MGKGERGGIESLFLMRREGTQAALLGEREADDGTVPMLPLALYLWSHRACSRRGSYLPGRSALAEAEFGEQKGAGTRGEMQLKKKKKTGLMARPQGHGGN